MRLVLLSFMLALPWIAPLAARADTAPPPWKKIGEENGLLIYQREVPGSPIVAFKSDGELEAPIAKVAAVLLDDERSKEWVERLGELRTVRMYSPSEYLEYSHIEMPFVLKDREFLTHVWLELNEKDKSFAVRSRSVDDPAVPERKDRVRGQIVETLFTLYKLSPSKTRVVAELHVDPKGSVPKWIVNMFQRKWPANAFKAVRGQVQKNDITMPERFRAVTKPLDSY